METIKCKYCKEDKSKYGIKNHERYCKDNPNKEEWVSNGRGAKKGSIPYNKGKSLSNEHKKKISESLKGKSSGRCLNKQDEEERKRKISESMKNNPKAGGLRKGSGIGRKGYYKGIWCDSSWELAWVIYMLDHNIDFKRNTKGFDYQFEGEQKKYYPDFIINESYYEIKGRRSYSKLDEQTKEKIKQFKGELKVLYEDEMMPILEYVIDKFGEDFYLLYERRS